MAELLKNRFLYVSAETWKGIADKSAYNNSIVFVKNGNDGVAIYTQGATFGTLDEAEVKAIIESYGYLKTTDFNTAKGLLEQAIADAKSGAIADAKTYTDGQIEIVTKAIADKNVSAEGDAYVNATADGNKVTVSATESTKASLALADSAVQSVVTGETNGTIKVDDTEVAVKGLGTAAYETKEYFEGYADDAAGEVKTELLGDAKTYTTLGALEDAVEAINAGAKTYTIKPVTEGLGANVEIAYQLYEKVGENETPVGSLINIPKDDSLVNVETTTDEKGNKVVKFTYNLADGTEKEITLDLSDYVTESEFGNGLQVVDNVVSVKLDSTSEEYLTVSESGIKVAGIGAIKTTANSAVQSAEGDDYVKVTKEGTKLTFTTTTKEVAAATADADGLATAFNVKSYVDNAVSTNTNGLNSELSADSQYFTKVVITNGKLDATKSTKANISEAKLNGYSNTVKVGSNITSDDSINSAIAKLETTLDWGEITIA